MANLQDVPFRPACVVSALPRRFRESLEKELGRSVAISNCPLGELESTVRRQSATLAVVGVSGSSLDVAERLSHNENGVKVFLAHYNDTLDPAASKNGFAGVFDLRAEPKRLADSIRGSIANTHHYPSCPRPVRRRPLNLVSKFIAMQERIAHPAALMETILETFLEITGSGEGLLLLPQTVLDETFIVAAGRGQDAVSPQSQILLERRWLPILLKGDVHLLQEGLQLETSSTTILPLYHIVAPVVCNGRLCALLVGDSFHDSEILSQFLEGLSYTFRELTRKKDHAEKQRLLHDARLIAGTSWILADEGNRIIHREGQSFPETTRRGRFRSHPRVWNLLHRALLGENGNAVVRDRLVTGQSFQSAGRKYIILSCASATDPKSSPIIPSTSSEFLHAFARSVTATESERFLRKELIENLSLPGLSSPKFDIKRLEPLGIEQTTTSAEIPRQQTSGMCLLLLTAKDILKSRLTASFFATSKTWHLTVEQYEEELSSMAVNLTNDSAFQVVLRESRIGKVSLRQSIYGFQLTGDIPA